MTSPLPAPSPSDPAPSDAPQLGVLGIDDGELATCVSCGLCLPHCPTYRVTGEEALSPRGRVAAMRQVQWEGAAVDDSFVRSMETCVQCRGCETACPSGVPFGHLIEPARAALAERPASGPDRAGATERSAPRSGQHTGLELQHEGARTADTRTAGELDGRPSGAAETAPPATSHQPGPRRTAPAAGADADADTTATEEPHPQVSRTTPADDAGTAAARAPHPQVNDGVRANVGRALRRLRRSRPRSRPPFALRVGLRTLRHHRLVLAGSTLAAVGQRLHLVPPRLSTRLGLPVRLPLLRPRLRPSGTDVWLFTGCVMDAWMRHVHADVQRVVEATGAGVAVPGHGAGCCGALSLHAGVASDARDLAERTMAAFPGDAPILVDAAGCGAMLRDYGHLLGTAEAETFSARVKDVHEWLAERIDALVATPPRRHVPPRIPERPPLSGDGANDRADRRHERPAAPSGSQTTEPSVAAPPATQNQAPPDRPVVAVQDPCHLRHVQRAHEAVRTVLTPFATVVELDDEGLCCGAGGAFAAVQPDLAGAIRDRKVAAIERSGAPVVVSANPGCALHLANAGLTVVHPCTIIASALGK